METIPAYLQPAAADIADGTPAGDAIMRRAARLAALPEDQALRLVLVALVNRADNPRDLNMAAWLRLHSPEYQGGRA